ncbi:MAG: recombinase family protein, partial [Planctomycetes bacterium]|nr:recombinase family protein [Planctomycetota bacterium]
MDPKGGRILVNEAEALRVREVFELYLREQSLVATAVDLNNRGWTTKAWTTKKGKVREGSRFDKANLFGLLANVIYTGQVNHKGTIFPGEHPAIVDLEVWRRAQALLLHNGRTGGKRVRNRHGALLRELLRCAPCDSAMSHSYTVKRKRLYRYYVCLKAQKQGWTSCPTKAVPAQEVERFVVERIRAIGKDRGVLDATLKAARAEYAAHLDRLGDERAAGEKEMKSLGADAKRLLAEGDGSNARLADLHDRMRAAEQRLTGIRERVLAAEKEKVDAGDLEGALSLFDPVWDALFPKEQARILRLLVERVGYDGREGTLAVTFRPSG